MGGLGLLHFALHGTFDPNTPNEAGLPLADGSVFRPSDLQLEQQNPGVGTRFRRIDSDHFSARIYAQDQKPSTCRIWLSRGRMGDIAYHWDDSAGDNTYSAVLWVENDGYSMWFKPGLQVFSSGKERLNAQEAAEYFWSMLIKRLQ